MRPGSNAPCHTLVTWFVLLASAASALAQREVPRPPAQLTNAFRWTMREPLFSAVQRPPDHCYSVKDPTVVRFEDRWHLFVTIRSVQRSHQIEYISFSDWSNAAQATRHVLTLTNGYFCAPQVFFFEPQKKWYLIYQALDTSRKVPLQPAFSTSTNLSDPSSWSSPSFLFPSHPENVPGWIDFWVICDDRKAHLFFTSNNGLMWRAETSLADFPHHWTTPQIVLRDDIFEASHTYKLTGSEQFLTVVESLGPSGRRYYKAYLASQLDGHWQPLATTWEKPFAGLTNLSVQGAAWTDSVSHGELIRAGFDQRMELNPMRLKFLFQGVSDADRAGKKYGEIPWQLGLLECDL